VGLLTQFVCLPLRLAHKALIQQTKLQQSHSAAAVLSDKHHQNEENDILRQSTTSTQVSNQSSIQYVDYIVIHFQQTSSTPKRGAIVSEAREEVCYYFPSRVELSYSRA